MRHKGLRRATLLAGALLLPTALQGSPGDSPTWEHPIRTLTPPKLPCEVRYMTGDAEALYFLDRCDTILRWDPVSDSSRLIELVDPPQSLRRIAVGEEGIAASEHQEEGWTRRAALNDRFRFAGSHFPTIIGETMYLYMPSDGVVHAVLLGD